LEKRLPALTEIPGDRRRTIVWRRLFERRLRSLRKRRGNFSSLLERKATKRLVQRRIRKKESNAAEATKAFQESIIEGLRNSLCIPSETAQGRARERSTTPAFKAGKGIGAVGLWEGMLGE